MPQARVDLIMPASSRRSPPLDRPCASTGQHLNMSPALIFGWLDPNLCRDAGQFAGI